MTEIRSNQEDERQSPSPDYRSALIYAQRMASLALADLEDHETPRVNAAIRHLQGMFRNRP